MEEDRLQGEVVAKPIFEGYTFIPASRRVRTTEKEVDFQTAPSELTTLKMRPDDRPEILENQRITLSVVPSMVREWTCLLPGHF